MATGPLLTECEFVVTVPRSLNGDAMQKSLARTTLGVLTELLASARRRLIIGAPFMQGGEVLSADPLGTALVAAIRRGVCVDFISTGTSLSSVNLASFRSIAGGRIRAFQPSANVADARTLGSHAKFCVSDGVSAYVGSANITQAGIAGHLEMGVLLHGRLAHRVCRFVESLFNTDYLIEIFWENG